MLLGALPHALLYIWQNVFNVLLFNEPTCDDIATMVNVNVGVAATAAISIGTASYRPIPADKSTPVQQRLAYAGPNGTGSPSER
jgi:hypothetical protein